MISKGISAVRLKLFETSKSYCVQSFQSDTLHKTGDGLVVTLK